MNKWRVIATLSLTYVLFAILLNSVGTVILQSINSYGISKTEASVLEGLKDLPIAFVGFLIASFVPRIGYKNGLLIGTALIGIACTLPLFLSSFTSMKLLFFIVGCSFGLVKIALYSSIGLVTSGRKEHASLTNIIEGIFMLGVLAGYWLFSYYIDPLEPSSQGWLDVYQSLIALSIICFIASLTMRLDESQATRQEETSLIDDFLSMLRLSRKPMVCVFVLSVFIYVLIEQGIGSWLPTFNNEVFKLPTDMSVQFASIYAAALALGRFSIGIILRKVSWYPVLNFCVIAAGLLILLIIPATKDLTLPAQMGWGNAPWEVFMLPMIGLVLAPIYPAINSCILSALPKHQHAPMTGLIVIFSALGGTTGSIIMGKVFEDKGGTEAFLLVLIPISVILISLYFFKRSLPKHDSI